MNLVFKLKSMSKCFNVANITLRQNRSKLKVTVQHLYQDLFFVKVADYKSATLSKRDTGTGVL